MIEILRETIKKYLRNDMTVAERTAFQHRIATEPDVAKAVNLIRLEKLSIDVMFENDLRQQMKQWQTENAADTEGVTTASAPKNKGLWWIVVALIGLLGGLFYWFSTKSDKLKRSENLPLTVKDSILLDSITQSLPPVALPQNSKKNDIKTNNLPTQTPKQADARLAFEYYELPDFAPNDTRGNASENSKNAINLAEKALKVANFQQAVDVLSRDSTTEKAYVQFLLGHAYFNLRQFKAAEIAFRQSVALGNAERKEKGEWYQVLSLLGRGNQSAAKEKLALIANDEAHLFTKKAKSLLEKLE